MKETIKSIAEKEMKRFTPVDQQRLVDAGVYNKVMFALNEPGVRGLTILPGEGFLNPLFLERHVEPENVDQVRAVVGRAIQEVADQSYLG